MNEIKLYAPVIIPTLNRADHLKRCLTSLMNNGWAKYTDVYISVDYPPAEKYVAGYNQVKNYLQTADFSGFRKLTVAYQTENLGPFENYAYLKNWIRNDYDRFIFSEDDNEFAPNFLEYQNKGLTLFAEDERVMAICAAKDTHWETGGQAVTFAKLCPAYGFGVWFAKEDALRQAGDEIILSKKTLRLSSVLSLARKNCYLAIAYITEVLFSDSLVYWDKNGNLSWCDSLRSMYLHWTDSVCVVPQQAKARTWGNDGTGVNMQKLENEEMMPLDTAADFAYPPKEQIAFYPENYKKGDAYLRLWGARAVIKAVVCYLLLQLCGKDRNKAKGLVDRLRKNRKR